MTADSLFHFSGASISVKRGSSSSLAVIFRIDFSIAFSQGSFLSFFSCPYTRPAENNRHIAKLNTLFMVSCLTLRNHYKNGSSCRIPRSIFCFLQPGFYHRKRRSVWYKRGYFLPSYIP